MKTEFTTTLYKEEQIWTCNVVDYGTHAEIEVLFGKNGGKIQKKITIITDGKNIGKANETTYLQQAISEAQSKVNKQKDKLYSDVQAVLHFRSIPRPMLAHTYEKHAHKIKFPCYIQPKMDGVRCLALDPDMRSGPPHRQHNPIFVSRQGKKFSSLRHLADETSSLLNTISVLTNSVVKSSICLDGELYSNDLEFQQIISAVKRDEPNELTNKIEYHVYDLATHTLTYKERMGVLMEAFDKVKPKLIINVQTYEIDSQKAVVGFHEAYVREGKEGAMLRNADGLYLKDKRSYDLQKVKSFNDDEFEIIDWSVDKNNHAVFTCVTKAGDKFDVKPSGDNEIRDWYTDNADKLIGTMLTVKFFGYTTGDNPVPRFPVGVKVKNEYE